MNFDGATSIKTLSLYTGATLSSNTTVYSTAVTPNGSRYTLFLVNSYFASGTLALTCSLQDSADGVNFADIGTAVIPNQAAATVGATSFLVRHEACREYVRIRLTRTNTPNVVVGVTCIQFGKVNTSTTQLVDMVAR